MKEVFFFESKPDNHFIDTIKRIDGKFAESWSELEDCFGHELIYTTQMGALGWDWLAEGYLVTIADSTGIYKLHLGAGNKRYSGELRKEHDLFKMWTKGVFALYDTESKEE